MWEAPSEVEVEPSHGLRSGLNSQGKSEMSTRIPFSLLPDWMRYGQLGSPFWLWDFLLGWNGFPAMIIWWASVNSSSINLHVKELVATMRKISSIYSWKENFKSETKLLKTIQSYYIIVLLFNGSCHVKNQGVNTAVCSKVFYEVSNGNLVFLTYLVFRSICMSLASSSFLP